MKKPNPMLAKIEARHQAEMTHCRLFTAQQCKDVLLIAAHRAFGFGPDRAKALGDAFDAAFTEYAEMTLEDAKIDRDIWYTKAKVDEALREICGAYFQPWDERYLGL